LERVIQKVTDMRFASIVLLTLALSQIGCSSASGQPGSGGAGPGGGAPGPGGGGASASGGDSGGTGPGGGGDGLGGSGVGVGGGGGNGVGGGGGNATGGGGGTGTGGAASCTFGDFQAFGPPVIWSTPLVASLTEILGVDVDAVALDGGAALVELGYNRAFTIGCVNVPAPPAPSYGLVEVSSQGEVTWLGSTRAKFAMAPDPSSGGVIIVGDVHGDFLGTQFGTGLGVARLDANGVVLSHATFQGSLYLPNVAVAPDGSAAIYDYAGAQTFDFGNGPEPNVDHDDLLAVIGPDNQIRWSGFYGPPCGGDCWSGLAGVAFDDAGGLVVFGGGGGNDIFGTGPLGGFLAHLDSTGAVITVKDVAGHTNEGTPTRPLWAIASAPGGFAVATPNSIELLSPALDVVWSQPATPNTLTNVGVDGQGRVIALASGVQGGTLQLGSTSTPAAIDSIVLAVIAADGDVASVDVFLHTGLYAGNLSVADDGTVAVPLETLSGPTIGAFTANP
jgi:hypothetical protein